jgi:hypothetical protein
MRDSVASSLPFIVEHPVPQPMQSSWLVVVAAGKPFREAAEVMRPELEQLVVEMVHPLPELLQMAPMDPEMVELPETTAATLGPRGKHGQPVVAVARDIR